MSYTVLNENRLVHYQLTKKNKSFFLTRFIQWVTNQDKEHHIAWSGISLISMAAVFFPLTMAIILSHSTALGLIIPAMVSLILVFVLNLSAQSTRYIIPAFAMGILIDVIAIIAALLV